MKRKWILEARYLSNTTCWTEWMVMGQSIYNSKTNADIEMKRWLALDAPISGTSQSRCRVEEIK
jgi:hypothetical protein